MDGRERRRRRRKKGTNAIPDLRSTPSGGTVNQGKRGEKSYYTRRFRRSENYGSP